MLLDLHLHGVPATGALRRHVEDRVGFALGRLGDRVGRVSVLLDDLNGPRGGADKCCRIVAAVRPVGRLVVESRGENAVAIVDATADRIGQLARRLLGKRRAMRRPRRGAVAAGAEAVRTTGIESRRASVGGEP